MSLIYKGQNLFIDNTSVKNVAKNNITPILEINPNSVR